MRIEKGPPLLHAEGTVATLFLESAKRYASQPAFEWREATGIRQMTYAEVEARVREVAAGLHALGLRQGDKVAILADTRPEWGLADLGIQLAGGITVTLFTTLAPDQMAFMLNDSGVRFAFVDSPTQFGKLRQVAKDVARVETWIAFDPHPPADDAIAKRTIAMSELLARGRAAPARALGTSPRPEDASTIIYTSGTTGIPKGAVLTHRNCVAAARMPTQAFDLDKYDGRSTVVFLPLAHSLTRGIFLNGIDLGARIGFSSPRTFVDDLRAMPPLMLASAPRIYERIHDRYRETAAKSPPAKRLIMERAREIAIRYGAARSDGGTAPLHLELQRAFYDRLVYRKMREQLGFTRILLMLSGAAAIRPELLHFFRGLGITIVEAWGLTETTAPGTTNPLDRTRPGTVGRPFPGVEVALDDDGEILITGPNVFQGYHERPDENEQAFVEKEGRRWFRTGDIGKFDEAGYLKIIDRKKELEILDTGKKIAPISVEETLKTVSPFVAESCLIGTGRKYAGCLIQPNYDRLVNWAREHHIPFDEKAIVIRPDPTGSPMTYEVGQDLLAHPEVQKLYEGEVAKCNAKVADYERIRTFRLVPHAFTIDRDELTVKLSKKRRNITAHYADLVESMF